VADDLSLVAFEAGLIALTIWMVAALWRAPWATAHATDLVVDLAESRAGALRDRLAHALGDPGLEVGFHVDGVFVDAAGERIELPPPASGRRATVIERSGRPVAVLIHDGAVLEDPGLRASLAEAADLASANAALQSELHTQIGQLRESRRRLVVAADEERRRLERRLQETAERRLERLLDELSAPATGADAGAPADLRDQLEQSLVDLRRLGAGLHPRELDEGGLHTALRALAGRSPVPVDLQLAGVGDLAPEHARTAYFVCSEGLANVAKYAQASRATLIVAAANGRLRIEVADDGRGGADPAQGSGLRGLADRVEAVGGALTLKSPPGRGTRLTAELPLTGSP
jgi:signal transduction histidine kinase